VPKNALIVIDMLNTYDHEDADRLAESVAEKLPQIVALRDEAREREDVLLTYVNDNQDQWDATREAWCSRPAASGFMLPIAWMTRSR